MGCDGLIQPFNPSKSSTFQNTTRKIDIPYMFDLGDALGTMYVNLDSPPCRKKGSSLTKKKTRAFLLAILFE